MTKVFISYSRKDIDFARRLAGDLETAGYDVWWDLTDLRGGDDWPRVIPAAIESSDRFIVVLSPNSAESDWVEKEYTQALSLRKKIIPIMLKRSSIPFALNTINYIDFTGDDYAASLNNLLRVLGYTGEPVVPAPPPFSLPGVLRKYAIPIGIGLLILLALLARFALPPAPSLTPTPSSIPTNPATPVVIITDTPTVIPTNSPTPTPTATETKPTSTDTPTPTSTSTPAPTATVILAQGLSLPICVYSDSSTVNVREGPGTGFYKVLGSLESDGTQCPFFNARIANAEGVWFQLAPDQQFAGRWISGRGLAAADTDLPPLPICIYHPDSPEDAVEIRVLPFKDGTLLENPLKANGASCPFFDTRIENNEGTWYRVSPNQRGKVEFQPYAGGWVHEDFLVIHTLSLPTVTLTPTPLSSDTPTVSPSPTPTSTPIPIPTDTETATPTEAPTS